MKVLHLITSIDKGGAENHLACLVKGLKKKKYKSSYNLSERKWFLEKILLKIRC